MPLKRGESRKVTEENFREFGKGRTYAKTRAKFGKKRADKQRIAVVLKNKRDSAKKRKSGRGGR